MIEINKATVLDAAPCEEVHERREYVRRDANHDDADDHRVAAGNGREHGGVHRVAGAEISGGDKGLACHE